MNNILLVYSVLQEYIGNSNQRIESRIITYSVLKINILNNTLNHYYSALYI